MFGLLSCLRPFSAVSTISTFSAFSTFSTFSTISAIGSCPADERFFKNRRVVVKSLVFDERIRRPAGVPLPARLPHGFHDARDGRCGKVGAPALVHDRVHAREEAWGDDAHDRAEGERLAVFEGDFGRKLPALHGFVGNGENGVVGRHKPPNVDRHHDVRGHRVRVDRDFVHAVVVEVRDEEASARAGGNGKLLGRRLGGVRNFNERRGAVDALGGKKAVARADEAPFAEEGKAVGARLVGSRDRRAPVASFFGKRSVEGFAPVAP